MTQDNYQLTNHAAEIYETQKVNAIFRPLAEATLREVSIEEHDLVLDIACGTGVVSRCIRDKITTVHPLTGVDLNEGMIEVARTLTRDRRDSFEWHQADVIALPFDDHTFTIAVCQQGLQFFPDRALALAEIRRVLQADGRFVLTVWSAISPLFTALAEALRDNIGSEIAERSLAPFAFRDEQVIRTLVEDAGFHNLTLKTITIERRIAPASISIPKEIAGNPIGSDVMARDPAVVTAIVKQVKRAIQPFQVETGFAIPQETYLFQAQA